MEGGSKELRSFTEPINTDQNDRRYGFGHQDPTTYAPRPFPLFRCGAESMTLMFALASFRVPLSATVFSKLGRRPALGRAAIRGRQAPPPGVTARLRPPWGRHLRARLLHAAFQHAQGLG